MFPQSSFLCTHDPEKMLAFEPEGWCWRGTGANSMEGQQDLVAQLVQDLINKL